MSGPIPKWKQISEDKLRQIVSESTSMSQVAKKIGYTGFHGSSSRSLSNGIKSLGIDISHFTYGKLDYSWMDNGTVYNSNYRLHILQLKGEQCEMCGITTWLDKPITFEIHHINGDKSKNDLDNLQVLCPNCHSQTDNFRNKKRVRGAIGETR